MCVVNAENLIHLLRNNEIEFIDQIQNFIEHKNVIEFIDVCSKAEKKLSVTLCSKNGMFLIHKIFEKVERVDSILFIEDHRSFYMDDSKLFLDLENRTWLHTAVMFDRGDHILDFLINKIKISVEVEDVYNLTPLHFACQKCKCRKEELCILIKKPEQLIKQSINGFTPLELLCKSEENLSCIKDIEGINMKQLLIEVDNTSKGTMLVEKLYVNKRLLEKQLWLTMLQKNDKYHLILYIQEYPAFNKMYYLQEANINIIIHNCTENGKGLLTFVKGKYMQKGGKWTLNKILHDLTMKKLKEQKKDKYVFHKSSLFLCLITGRFELVKILLQYTQFPIVPYAMIVCLICRQLSSNSAFSLEIKEEILELKNFCEQFAIKVMNITFTKDHSSDKVVITRYIGDSAPNLDSKSIIDIAYHAKCKMFLSLPACQQTLDNIWKKGKLNSPRIKFYFHSLVHFAFLILFSYLLIESLEARFNVVEILCYVYAVGYFFEEMLQIYYCVKDDWYESYYKDAANIIDALALFSMFVGFFIHIIGSIPTHTGRNSERQFKESKEVKLFVIRLFLCLSLILFYMRVLYFASIFEVFGPKLKMIAKMITKDLLPLLAIFSVFIISFGVAFQSLLFPNSFYAKDSLDSNQFDKKMIVATVGDIFRRSTFSIFDAHYTLDEIENNQHSYITDSSGRYAVYFLLLVFVVVVNVMLMNLLIALFSYTVTVIIQGSKVSWKGSRYKTIKEYYDRTVAPPPINIIFIIVYIVRKLLNRYVIRKRKETQLELNDYLSNDLNDDMFISYYIFQAFAVGNHRYDLIQTEEDKEYKRENRLKKIENTLNFISKNISK